MVDGLRRTPLRHQMLTDVHNGDVHRLPDGKFARRDRRIGSRERATVSYIWSFTDRLLDVAGPGRTVVLTGRGAGLLDEWDAAKAEFDRLPDRVRVAVEAMVGRYPDSHRCEVEAVAVAAFEAGYAAGHEDQMQMRLADEQDRRAGRLR